VPWTHKRETLAFRAVVAVLRADPVLDRNIRTWQVCKGDAGEWKPFSEVMLPALLVVPEFDMIRLDDEEDYVERLAIRIRQGVTGTNADDRLDLWGALRDALQFSAPCLLSTLPDDTAVPAGIDVRQYLRLAGIHRYAVSDPPKLVGEPSVNQVSQARLALDLFVPQ
jgi:hypothetical protein